MIEVLYLLIKRIFLGIYLIVITILGVLKSSGDSSLGQRNEV